MNAIVNPIHLAVSLLAIHQLFGYINFVLYRPSIHQIHPASRVDRAASRYIVFDTSFWRYSSDTAIQRHSDTAIHDTAIQRDTSYLMYTLGPALRIPDVKNMVKNMGRDVALERLRICPCY